MSSSSKSEVEEKKPAVSAAEAEEALMQWKPRMGQLTVADKIEQGEQLKLQANIYVKRGDYQRAISRYAKVFAYVNGLSVEGDAMQQYASKSTHMTATTAQGTQIQALQIACWSNMALCYLKLSAASASASVPPSSTSSTTTTTANDGITRAEKALTFCDKVLALDGAHSKARFRKAQALAQCKRFDAARELLHALAVSEPTNVAVRNELKRVTAALKEYDAQARASSGFQNLFQQNPNGLFGGK